MPPRPNPGFPPHETRHLSGAFFSGIGVVAAGGVGGGSLVYANINIRPDAVVFDDPGWPRSIDREALDPYYDRVAAMLTVAPVPQSIVLSKARPMSAGRREAGRDVFDPTSPWHGKSQTFRAEARTGW